MMSMMMMRMMTTNILIREMSIEEVLQTEIQLKKRQALKKRLPFLTEMGYNRFT